MSKPPRYSNREFPPYTYVPGKQPHPISDPRGHMHGHEAPDPPPLDPEQWNQSASYLFAVDLFNHGFYWEAHEVWESLWIAAGRAGILADFLKGLIKLAAAGVKELEGNPTGIDRHRSRALELLSGTAANSQSYGGLHLPALLTQVQKKRKISEIALTLGE